MSLSRKVFNQNSRGKSRNASRNYTIQRNKQKLKHKPNQKLF